MVTEQTLITNVKYHPLGSLGWLACQHRNVEDELRVEIIFFAFVLGKMSRWSLELDNLVSRS